MEFFIILGVLLVLFLAVDKALRKVFKVEKKRLSDSPGKKADAWSRGIILVAALAFIPFVVTETGDRLIWFWVFYLTGLHLVQAFLQWKYIRESREHLVTLCMLPVGLAALLFIRFYFF